MAPVQPAFLEMWPHVVLPDTPPARQYCITNRLFPVERRPRGLTWQCTASQKGQQVQTDRATFAERISSEPAFTHAATMQQSL